MKKYKYQMRQMGINVNKITKTILIILLLILFFSLILDRYNDKLKKYKMVSFIGQTIYASEMPINSYMNELDCDTSEGLIEKIVGFIYPINDYIRVMTSNVYVGNFDEPIVLDNSNPTVDTSVTADDDSSKSNEVVGSPTAPTSSSSNTKPTVDDTPIETATATTASPNVSEVMSNNVITGVVYPKPSLENFDFVFSNFYTIPTVTTLTNSILKPKEFLAKDLSVSHDASTPQILIFHTHSQETFTDSIEGDPNTSIVGVGEYLTRILREKYGLNVIHDSSVYDFVDGKLDRSKAYTYSEAGIRKILDSNPSIEVVIDLHRDGVPETTHLVTEVNGKQTAKVMFFNGISYSKLNGELTNIRNPFRDDNLAMSLQMQLLGNAYYQGFLRRIYINAYKYNLHLRAKSMLIEAGAQTNSVAEEMNAMEPLADILNKLLSGQKAYE